MNTTTVPNTPLVRETAKRQKCEFCDNEAKFITEEEKYICENHPEYKDRIVSTLTPITAE